MKVMTLFVLSVVVLFSAIKVVVAQHEVRQLFREIQVLMQAQDDLNEEWGRLQLEQSTWTTDARVELIAKQSLGMINPPNRQFIVLPD